VRHMYKICRYEFRCARHQMNEVLQQKRLLDWTRGREMYSLLTLYHHNPKLSRRRERRSERKQDAQRDYMQKEASEKQAERGVDWLRVWDRFPVG